MTKVFNKKAAFSTAAIAALAVLGAVGVAEASTAGGAFAMSFDDVHTDISGLMNGSLGKVLSGLFIVGGIAAGVARQSLMPFMIGGGAGVGLNQAPTVLNAMFSTTQSAAIDLQITAANLGLM